MAQPAEPVPPTFSGATTNLLPPLPVVPSPVDYFRKLLLMSPAERNQSLAGRTPESRARILQKVREYRELDPDERELRLRATELRWYLMPLLKAAPADRDPQLTEVPPELRELVRSRLVQWDSLPASLRQEFLANEKTLPYFARIDAPNAPEATPEQQKIADQFNQIFALNADEQQKILGTLSGPERAKMEQTLQSFGKLPVQQRVLCIRNYAKFAGMNNAERAEFLKNADSWSKMSPQERQTWRDLVANVPMLPPMPSPLMPPRPHATPKSPKAGMATN